MVPQNISIVNTLETTRLVLSIDLFQTQLTSNEQNALIARAFKQALERIKQWAQNKGEKLDDFTQPPAPLRGAYASGTNMEPTVQEKILNRDPETPTTALTWVTESENLSAAGCGTPVGLDEAIILALRKGDGNSK